MKFLSSEKLSEHKYKTPEGYLICTDAILARTGKQTYRKNEVFADSDDDSEIEVDRQANEVFSQATLASFENKPVTVEHPDEDVNSSNYNQHSVGFVRDVHKGQVNGQDVMLGTLVITDEQTIEEIENGEHTDLSCGYDCDIIDEANPQQRNIRGNHVALCQQGRAGIARIVDSAKNEKSKPEFEAKGKWLWDEEVYDWYDTGRKMYYEEIKRQHWVDSFNDSIRYLTSYKGSDIWEDEDTKELYLALTKSGKKLSRLNTKDLNKAKQIIEERLSFLEDDANIQRYGQLSNDSTAPADLERIPLEARKEMKKAKDKKATLIGIAGQMQDIINRADKIEKDDLRAKAKKILSDLKAQFDIKEADFITVDSITKDDVNVDIERVINVAKSRAFELTRQSKNYLTFRYKGNDRNKDVSEIAKILPNNMSASWDEDSLEIAIRDVVKDDITYSVKRENDLVKDIEYHKRYEVRVVYNNFGEREDKGSGYNSYNDAKRSCFDKMQLKEKYAENGIIQGYISCDYKRKSYLLSMFEFDGKHIKDVTDKLYNSSSRNEAKQIGLYDSLKNDSLKVFEIQDGNHITIIRAKDLTDAINKIRR